MPNLRGIIMQGQGVDYMMADTTAAGRTSGTAGRP